jgi:CRISPR-associated endonuclease/helicase Cas3
LSDLIEFWAKTKASAGGLQKKALPHHLLDVAATALVLQESTLARLRREATALDVEPQALARTRACLAGWHDLGKASRAFQAKVPAFLPRAFGPYQPGDARAGFDHGAATGWLLSRPLDDLLSGLLPVLDATMRESVASTVGGHHGRPLIDMDRFDGPRAFRRSIADPGVDAAREAALAVWEAVGRPILPIRTHRASAFCWGLAGFTTLADWVGSDSGHFLVDDNTAPSGSYWPIALERAQEAVATKRLIPARIEARAGAATLAGHDRLTPMQIGAETTYLPAGPTLALIEDSMGAGKTEAALILAHRMMAAGKGEGIYIALPTMATANAMFDRMARAYRRLFEPGARPSLALAHGRRNLSESFAAVRLAGADQGDGVAAECGAWIADDRRRAFFAEVGAGTIDQALLSILPRKHFALRQHALAGRILVVDEAHAYDGYEAAELTRLLRFQAGLGGSAIILSATLTRRQRQELAGSFLQGLNETPRPGSSGQGYPLLTVHGVASTTERQIDPAPATVRRVSVGRLPDWPSAAEAIRTAVDRGGAVAVIRNSVDDAIATQTDLRGQGLRALLFHARFAMSDRLAIEREIIGGFGRNGSARAGRVVIATQVLQESLDVDFDLMISDLAPMDLLIQRAGRLWRHARKDRPIEGPRLLVVAPDWRAVDGPEWLRATQPRGASIYRMGVQWRTARALFQEGAIASPGKLRDLVEIAYADGDDLPDSLVAADDDRFAKERAATAQGRLVTLDWDAGYPGNPCISDDQEIGTRLGEPTLTLRLGRLVDNVIVPWAEAPADPASAWALSEVVVRTAWLGLGDQAALPDYVQAAIDAAKAAWPDFERRVLIAVVADDGSVLLERLTRQKLEYTMTQGLCWAPAARE